MTDYLQTANSIWMWIAAVPITVVVVIQAIIFYKRAMDSAKLVDLSMDDAKRAFKVGAVSAIGPAMGVFVVMLGLMSAIGGPLAWMRLSIIGAAPTELAAAEMAAKGMGTTMGGADYGLIEFSNAAWVMALNGGAWLLFTGLFTDKLDGLTKKVSGGDSKKIGILMIAAASGAFAYFFGNELFKIRDPENKTFAVAALAGAVSMMVLERMAKKYPKLAEYNLGVSMIIGMASSVIFNRIIA